MKNVETIFVLLTYRNEKDLKDFLVSAKKQVNDYAVIVVNSFFDNDSMEKIRDIADQYHCDFINIENKGYGYGNNQGIAYANENYNYRYLVVANPDTVIKNYPDKAFEGMEKAVIAPEIINKRGIKQNPMVWKKSSLADYLVYLGLKKNIKIFFYLGLGINKIIRQLFYIMHPNGQKKIKVYQAHGSFIIFSKYVLDKIGLPFDEKIFLFAEEGDLAHILKKQNLAIYYVPEIKVYHKEDGSMQFRDDLDGRLVAANVYVYEKYRKKDR